MNIIAFIIFLFALQILCLIVGGRSAKGLKSQEDYFLAGKGIRFFPLMMTFIATQIGGGVILGAAEEAYQFGWTVLFYPLGASLGLILLGSGIGRKLAQFQVSTIAQIFEEAYRSKFLKKGASLLSISTLFMILVAQVIASGKFMASLGITNPLWFTAFWGIVILYTAIGGLKAVVSTDIVQAAFFIAVFLFSFGYAACTMEMPLLQVFETNFRNSHFSFDPLKLYGWLFMPLLFMVIEQDMGQRCFAAKTPQTVSKAALGAGFCILCISFIPVFFGILAKGTGIAAPSGASILMAAIEQTTSPVIAALVGCAVLAAIISTADSLINAIGSNLAQDFELPFMNRKNIRASQAVSAVIALGAIFFSFYFNNVVDVLIQSYELSVSCLFVPIVFALFKKEGNALSACLAMTFGAIGFILFRIAPTAWPKEVLSLVFSFAGYGLGEAIIKGRLRQQEKGAEV